MEIINIKTRLSNNGRLCSTTKKINLEQQLEYDARQPWEDLANGIIKQATDEYKKALERIKKTDHYGWKLNAAQEIHSLNRWFRGKWFSMLTQVDPEYIIENLNKYYGNDATTDFINNSTVYEKERI